MPFTSVKQTSTFFSSSEFRDLIKSDATRSYTYKDSTKCFLEFTSISAAQPVKKFRLDNVLSNLVSLPKPKINLRILFQDAQSKGIIPMRIVQMNEHKDIIKTIILDDSSEEDDLIIPDPQNATIEYKQEFALSNQSFSMTMTM